MILLFTIIFILGLIIGSFLNVCIYRIPEAKSVVKPRSQCPKCNTGLKSYDLIPVLSFIINKGKCRYCGEEISIRYLVIELLTACVFVLLFSKFSFTIEFIFYACLISILIVITFIDIDHRIIPDELVIAAFAIGIAVTVYNVFVPMDIYLDRNWWNPLLGILPGSGSLLVIAIIGALIYKTDDAMGMGDVKIFAPIGLFLGWRMCFLALLLSVLLAGITSFTLIATKIKKKRDTIPFGPFIALATSIVVLWGWDIVYWYINYI